MQYLSFAVLALLVLSSVNISGQAAVSIGAQKTIAGVDKRVKRYVEMREAIRKRQPTPSENSTPEQIQAYKATLQKAVQAARVNARQGDIFTQQVTRLIRSIITTEFKGWERTELRKVAF